MRPGRNIHFDLENTPIEIRTDSRIGRDDRLKVLFKSGGYTFAGGFQVMFGGGIHQSKIYYYLSHCSGDFTDFPTALPSSNVKDWRITLNRKSGAPQLIVHCNGKQVLDVTISGTTCSDPDWNKYWSCQRPARMVYSWRSTYNFEN